MRITLVGRELVTLLLDDFYLCRHELEPIKFSADPAFQIGG